MKITQASAVVTKVREEEFFVLLALNDQKGGPQGVRILLMNEKPNLFSSDSAAAKTALEVIDGLGLQNLVADKMPVMGSDQKVVEEEVTQEFRDHLTKMKFDGGRIWITVDDKRRTRLGIGFVDHTTELGSLWRLSPTNSFQPANPGEAAAYGMAILNALHLADIDHGHHVATFPDRSVILDDSGSEVVRQ